MKNYAKKQLGILTVILLIALIFSLSEAQDKNRQITWTPIPDAPQPFGKAAGGVIGDYLYVFGGQPHTDLALAYSFTDDAWAQSTPSDYRFQDAGYCVANEALYRFCGKGSKDMAEKFVPDGTGGGTWSAIPPPPIAFRNEGNSCCWDGGNHIYINNADNSNNPDGYFARYNITGESWITLPPPPHPRRYAGMVSLGGLVYLIGGLSGNAGDARVCQVYHPVDNSWNLIALHPDPLNYTNSTVISDGAAIWTVGHGGGFGNFPASKHVHYYDPANDTWTAETDLPVARGISLVGYQSSSSKIIQAGGTMGNGMRFVADGRIGELTPQEPGLLMGTVIDNWYFNPVFEVEVSVFDYNNTLVGVDTTDEYGAYEFILNPGVYSTLYTKFSYLDSTITDIVINPNDTAEVNVILTFQHQCDYYVGDVNGSWNYNGLDVTYGAAFFKGGYPPFGCYCECTPGNWWYVCGDVNGDCQYNLLDITYAIAYYKGGPPPIPCPDCPPIDPVIITH